MSISPMNFMAHGMFGSDAFMQVMNALANFRNAASEQSNAHQSCGQTAQPMSDCGCSEGSDSKEYDGEFSVVGDPHIRGDVEVDGDEERFNFTTKGGNGETINVFDTDNLDIMAKFDSLHRRDDNTYVTEETIKIGDDEIEIDADDDTLTFNGAELEDGTHACNGNTITKDGNKITIETADGQTIEVTDKGDYLNTSVQLDGFESSEMGGMVGDAISGEKNANADDYKVEDSQECGGSEAPGGSDCSTPQGTDWAVQLLNSLAAAFATSNPELSGVFSALANFIEQSQSSENLSAAA